MQSGRIVHRTLVNFTARLESGGAPAVGESVSIENISMHGARVIAHRPWREHERVILSEAMSEFLAEAEVVYCQRLSGAECAIGLRFERVATDPRPKRESIVR